MKKPHANIRPTAKNAGLSLRIEIRSYDNELNWVDGCPMHNRAEATKVVNDHLLELFKQADERIAEHLGLAPPSASEPAPNEP
jgi:hypothetical protein